MDEMFEAFAKFGNTSSDGKKITLSNSDKWMKQAGIIDGKNITTTDTAICFNKFKSKTVDQKVYLSFVEELAREKKMKADDLMLKLSSCGHPGMRATRASKSDAVSRLTDTHHYTGSHKERFDAKGKGKGKGGRVETADDSGYVSGYKNKDTYDANTEPSK